MSKKSINSRYLTGAAAALPSDFVQREFFFFLGKKFPGFTGNNCNSSQYKFKVYCVMVELHIS